MGFVHLHVHSHMSLLDSTIRIEQLVSRVKELGMGAVALTDHGNMFGAVQFMQACEQQMVKPIYGAEVFVRDPQGSNRNYHLVLLCMNREGFANLRSLISRSYLEFLRDGKPTLPREVIAAHAEGLIALSGCLGGEVPNALLRGEEKLALEAIEFYRNVFTDRRFFLEVQGNDLAEQQLVNRMLVDLARRTGLGLVATNNCHYLEPDDAVAHAVLVAIELRRTLSATQRRNLPLRSFHLASPEEMTRYFEDLPEAIENTERIVSMVEEDVFTEDKTIHFPVFTPPNGETTAQFLSTLAQRGLEERLTKAKIRGENPDEKVYRERLAHELEIIIRLKFDAYFLIVWDFIRWARDNNIPVGPGRGSGAGSLVAYAIGVTDIDPIKYVLLFERFLNPERVDMPDFDVDFADEHRDRVIEYVTKKYGRDRVCQIITYGSLKPKAVIKDVARVMGMSIQQSEQITKLIPDSPDMTLQKALSSSPELVKLLEQDDTYKELWEIACRLEGLHRHAGKHAAGVVIADRPIGEYAPLYMTEEGVVVTQFSKKDLEKVGLIKFDFLGITALTIIERIVSFVRARRAPDFDIENIPMDDKATFELIGSGACSGVFQIETRGLSDLVRRLRPESIEELTAAIALFRPGPIESGMLEDFVSRKHGQKPVEYLLPKLEPVLRETYGTVLYQEQVMLIASHLAGFTLGQADLMRRAMSKKKSQELELMRAPFIQGAVERGIEPEVASDIFNKLLSFGKYGFNKSHSAAYAVMAYRMAYLKAHFPTEFLCAVMSAEKDDQAKVIRLIHEAKSLGIAILPPDVNRSGSDFSIEDIEPAGKTAIRFGLSAIKGIGDAAVEAIMSARKDGPFTDVLEMLTRIDLKKVNRRALETLIRCGALDCFGHTRASLMESLDALIERAQTERAYKDLGQIGLFDAMPGRSSSASIIKPKPEWPKRELIAAERETLGYYISGHPMDPFKQDLERLAIKKITDLPSFVDSDVMVAGIIVARNDKITKTTQQKFAYITIEDLTGQVECFVGSKIYDQLAAITNTDEPVLIRGTVRIEDEKEEIRLMVNSIQRFDMARRSMYKTLSLILDLSVVKVPTVDELRSVALQRRGPCPITFILRLPGVGEMTLKSDSSWGVDISDATITAFENVLGAGNVVLQ